MFLADASTLMALKAYPADYAQAVDLEPGILARGPWQAGQVATRWRADRYEAQPDRAAAADAALLALQDRGSPTHDGLAARLAGYEAGAGGLTIELQPMRWALRLTPEDALGALSVLCAVRSADGRWLAGRRAAWVATWAGRWALGAGGAVEVGEDPGRGAGARARGGVVGRARAPVRRGARLPAQPHDDARRPGLAPGRRRGDARPRARRARLVARGPRRLAGRGATPRCGAWPACSAG